MRVCLTPRANRFVRHMQSSSKLILFLEDGRRAVLASVCDKLPHR